MNSPPNQESGADPMTDQPNQDQDARDEGGPMTPTELHARIMNLRADSKQLEFAEQESTSRGLAYKLGHRDARHAAAELALRVPQPVSPDVQEILHRIETARNDADKRSQDACE